MAAIIAVTGATGNIGSELTRKLLKRGARVRAIGRDAARLLPLAREGAEPMSGDIEDSDFLAKAFRGADAAWLMIPPDYAAPDPRAWQGRAVESLAQAVAASSLRRVALLSSAGAELPDGTGPIAGLHAFEGRLRDIPGLGAVVFRPGLFMENYLAAIPAIRAAGAVGSTVRPAVAVPTVATRDVAAAAAAVLESPSFGGWAIRPLLGARDYTGPEVARVLGASVDDGSLKYAQVPRAAYREGLVGAGWSPAVADDLLELEAALDDCRVQRTEKRTPENTTPTHLEQWARDTFAPAWRGAASRKEKP